MELRDPEIRAQLGAGLRQRIAGRKHSIVVDELNILRGAVRVDVAVITPGRLIGYEIKSDFDSLVRLQNQIAAYDQVFDRNYLVCGNKYAERALKMLPEHWGLTTLTALRVNRTSGSSGDDYKLKFRPVRPSKAHDGVDPLALAQLLRKDEAVQELMLRGHGRGLGRVSDVRAYELLSELVGPDELRATVARRLSLRDNWRA